MAHPPHSSEICDAGMNTVDREDPVSALSGFFELASSTFDLDLREDLISKLPDDLLIEIISRLSTKDAVMAGVVCRRWGKLPALATGSLVFETPISFWSAEEPFDIWEAEEAEYIKRVDDSLGSYQGHRLGDFKIMFDMEHDRKDVIDRWMLTAFSKGVHTLSLDLYQCYLSNQHYILSLDTLTSTNISSLVSLSLDHVNVKQEVLEYVLSSCPLLEELCVSWSEILLKLNIKGGSSLKLKSLRLSHCHNLMNVHISAPNLITYSQHRLSNMTELHVQSVPRIRHVSLIFPQKVAAFAFAAQIPQLHTLTLGITFDDMLRGPVFPKLRHLPLLRHLTWNVDGGDHISLGVLHYKYLIDAATFLDKFTLQREFRYRFRRRKLGRPSVCKPHKHLRVVELKGFNGSPMEMELACHLCRSATELQEVIVDLRLPYEIARPWSFWDSPGEDRDIVDEARETAKQLQEHLPQGAKLTIIP